MKISLRSAIACRSQNVQCKIWKSEHAKSQMSNLVQR